MSIILWVIQGFLAALFLFTGGMKLVLPIEEMVAQAPFTLPGLFLRFIGVAEVLGALGLILPGVTGIQSRLTWLAAAGLTLIMIGATIMSLLAGDVGPALFSLVVGVLSTVVAYGRKPH